MQHPPLLFGLHFLEPADVEVSCFAISRHSSKNSFKTRSRGGHAVAAVMGCQLSLLAGLLIGSDFKVVFSFRALKSFCICKTVHSSHPPGYDLISGIVNVASNCQDDRE